MKIFLIILILSCACVHLQAQDNIIITIAGKDTAAYCCDGQLDTNAMLNHAGQLCLDKFDNLYIADAGNSRVRKIVLSTGIITTVAGCGINGFFGDGGSATSAELFVPQAVCTDTSGNIYIGDALNHRIRRVDISTGIISTIVGNGVPGNSGDNGLATNAQIMTPAGLATDKYDNLYIADIDNNNIRKVTTTGYITTIAGNGTLGYSGDGGPAIDAQFNSPGDIGIDTSGNIVISDSYNNAIREVEIATGIIHKIAGNGIAGYSGNGGLAINALINAPYGIYINNKNDIFFIDALNGVARKIDGTTSIITTVVGCGILGFYGDNGPATNAQLRPDDIFLDNYGTMYIADYGNQRVREVFNAELGIKPLSAKNETSVYPNPVRDELNINGVPENTSYQLLNVTGVCVQQDILQQSNNTISIKNIIPGIYILALTDDTGERNMIRVVKE